MLKSYRALQRTFKKFFLSGRASSRMTHLDTALAVKSAKPCLEATLMWRC